jgi:hypothetical protein
LNIDGEGGFDVVNDTESHDIQAGDSNSEPETETSEGDETETEARRLVYNREYTDERESQTAKAKSRSSILDEIRSFDSNKQNDALCCNKQSEHSI